MQINNISNSKKILRKDILKRRNEINNAYKEKKSFKIFNRLIKLSEIECSDNICTYVSKGSEVDTLFMIEKLLCLNKSVYVPKSDIKSNLMTFYRINSLSELRLGAFSVPEPISETERYEQYNKRDICIVPALSFDKQGFRLGYGKGYYDRFLKDFTGIKIGLCFDEFIKEKLPKYETDIAVDMIISENQKIICKGGK